MFDEGRGAVWLEPISVGCGEIEKEVVLADLPEVWLVCEIMICARLSVLFIN